MTERVPNKHLKRCYCRVLTTDFEYFPTGSYYPIMTCIAWLPEEDCRNNNLSDTD